MKKINFKMGVKYGDSDYKMAEIMNFPGINQTAVPVFGPVAQSGSLDGTIIRIGGKKEIVTATIMSSDGVETTCKLSKSLAKDLRMHLYGSELRFSGTGKWTRDEDGKWGLNNSFIITGYDSLDESSLIETVTDLRSVKGSGWAEFDDPWEELKDIRDDC